MLKESSLYFLLHKEPGARNTGRLRALDEDFLAGFIYSGLHSIAVEAITCRQLHLPMLSCWLSMWDGSQWRKKLCGEVRGPSKTALPDFENSFHKCCEARMSVRNVALGGVEVKPAVRLHLAHLGRDI